MLSFILLVIINLTLQSKESNITINSPCHASHNRLQNDIAIQTGSHRQKRGATFVKDLLWPNGVIPYSISKTFPVNIYKNIKTAIRIWESHTCLTFVPLTNETYGLKFEPQDCGCCSFVGRQQFGNNKPQEISISGQDCEDVGHMLHEIGHAIGFWHEHVRPDRDRFVKLKKENIDPVSLHNFEKKNFSEINSLGERYDYDSIMHYSPRSFSKDSEKKTLIPVKKFKGIGQREQLSFGDMRQANKLYNCQPDENQCLLDNGGCQHYCVDLHHGHKCRCRKGFLLYIDGRNCHLSCNQWFEQPEGMIFSPNHPNNYPPDASCSWEIQAPTGYFIKLQILKFDLEHSYSCIFDVLNIRRLVNFVWEDVAVFCGKNFERKLTIRSPLIRLLFRSDSSTQMKGFKIFYQFVPTICSQRPKVCHLHPPISQRFYLPELVGQACDKEYTASAAQVRFPSTRPVSCVVKVSLRGRRRVVLIIKKLNILLTAKCHEEFVVVTTGNSQKTIGKLCGSMKSQIIYTNNSLVSIKTVLKSPSSIVEMEYFSF